MQKADVLAPLLAHFGASARVFFTDTLCRTVRFDAGGGTGHLHLLRSGTLVVREGRHTETLSEPSLLFYARPLTHRLEADPLHGADLACATVSFRHQRFNPVALALPERVLCPLTDLDGGAAILQVLFDEAFAQRPARQEALDRLVELVLIQLLRHMLARGERTPGLLHALGHPRLGLALAAIHADPARDWSVASLAAKAAMSRSSFAEAFHREVGQTPSDYLTYWRIALAQSLLKQGLPLKLVAEQAGYGSQAGFQRAFKNVIGIAPGAWRKQDG